jgi:hypothetical protein
MNPPPSRASSQFLILKKLLVGACLILVCVGLLDAQTKPRRKTQRPKRGTTARVNPQQAPTPEPTPLLTPTATPPTMPSITPTPTPVQTPPSSPTPTGTTSPISSPVATGSQGPILAKQDSTPPAPVGEPWYKWDMEISRDRVKGPIIVVLPLFLIMLALSLIKKRKEKKQMDSPEVNKLTWMSVSTMVLGGIFILLTGIWLAGARDNRSPESGPTNTASPEPTPIAKASSAPTAQASAAPLQQLHLPATPTPAPAQSPAAVTNPPSNPRSNPPASASANGLAQNKVDDKFKFDDTTAGQELTIPGTFEGEGVWQVELIDVDHPDVPSQSRDAQVVDKTKITFTLPANLKQGRYRVIVRLDAQGKAPVLYPVLGEMRIPPPADVPVTITTVQPLSPYPEEVPTPTPGTVPTPASVPNPGPQYSFVIAGSNFSSIPENNHIAIDDVPIDTPRCATDGQAGQTSAPTSDSVPCLSVESASQTRKLIVKHYSPTAFSRPLWVSVRVGNSVAKAATPLVFSSVSQVRLRIYALGAFILLLGTLYLLVSTGIKRWKGKPEKYGPLKAFLLERETNSYSLSKLQLTLFTLVTVFGYIYVFICTLLVQWKFELPPVPENLPGMMAISVGTSVITAGIGSRIGGKGAGPTSPSLADFITSGGVVLPERFQFFVWTLVSVGGVLVLILASDPVTLTQLPKLPDGMLYIMGLSSAGYLGGKLARGPGPSVKSLDAQLLPGNVVQFILNGDNLSSKATFQLDDEHIPADQVQIGQKTLQGQDLELCSMLEVKLSSVAQRYFDGPHVFRIVNPDSQGADFKYGATIEAVIPTKAGDPDYSETAANFIVRGTNFKDPSAAQWIDAAGNVTKLGPESVTKKSETELVVSLPPGTEPAKISILSPGGLTTTFDLKLSAHAESPTAVGPTIDDSEIAKVDVPEKPSEGGKPAEPAYTALEVTLTGDNLSSEASFQLDGEPIPADQVIVVDKTPGSQDPKLNTMLKVQLKKVDSRFYDGPRVLRITNPFSTGVDIKYGATIQSVGPVAAGDAPIAISVKGTNFKDPSSAMWTPAPGTGAGTEIPAENINKLSDTELEVTLTPGPAGPAKLTIKSPDELTATFDVTVGGEAAGEGEGSVDGQEDEGEHPGS